MNENTCICPFVKCRVSAGTRKRRSNQRSQRDDSRIQEERNKANDFTCKLQYDVSIFSNRRQSDLTKCPLMISQCEIMISRLVQLLESSYSESSYSEQSSIRVLRLHSHSTFYNMTLITTVRNQHNQMVDRISAYF